MKFVRQSKEHFLDQIFDNEEDQISSWSTLRQMFGSNFLHENRSLLIKRIDMKKKSLSFQSMINWISFSDYALRLRWKDLLTHSIDILPLFFINQRKITFVIFFPFCTLETKWNSNQFISQSKSFALGFSLTEKSLFRILNCFSIRSQRLMIDPSECLSSAIWLNFQWTARFSLSIVNEEGKKISIEKLQNKRTETRMIEIALMELIIHSVQRRKTDVQCLRSSSLIWQSIWTISALTIHSVESLAVLFLFDRSRRLNNKVLKNKEKRWKIRFDWSLQWLIEIEKNKNIPYYPIDINLFSS